METIDYINFVNEFIMRSIELNEVNGLPVIFYIRPIRKEYNTKLFYEIEGHSNDNIQKIYLKFPCNSKEDFYNAIAVTIIENLCNCDSFVYAANIENSLDNMFSVVTKNMITINFILEDAKDILIFNKFKEYLNLNLENRRENDYKKIKKI